MKMRGFWCGLGLRLGLVAGGVFSSLLVAGCGPRAIFADLAHHNISDEDLLSLLPQGQDAVLDVDLAAMRAWPPLSAILALLPSDYQLRLRELAADPLTDLDAICVGLRGLGTAGLEATLLVRGQPSRSKLWQKLQGQPGSREVTYHGMPLVETDDRALAQLTPQTLVLGSRVQVRQTIDIFRGVDHGARKQPTLLSALALAPSGKQGRPPILLALLPSAELRQRAHDAGMLRIVEEAQAVAVAVAVGDGFDVGIVASYPDLAASASALSLVKSQAAELSTRSLTKILGLERFLSPLIAVAVPQSKKRPTPELHLAYRLPGEDLSELLRRIEQIKQLFSSQRN